MQNRFTLFLFFSTLWLSIHAAPTESEWIAPSFAVESFTVPQNWTNFEPEADLFNIGFYGDITKSLGIFLQYKTFSGAEKSLFVEFAPSSHGLSGLKLHRIESPGSSTHTFTATFSPTTDLTGVWYHKFSGSAFGIFYQIGLLNDDGSFVEYASTIYLGLGLFGETETLTTWTAFDICRVTSSDEPNIPRIARLTTVPNSNHTIFSAPPSITPTEWSVDGRTYTHHNDIEYDLTAPSAPLTVIQDATTLLYDITNLPLGTQLGAWQLKNTDNDYTSTFNSITSIWTENTSGQSWKFSKQQAYQWYQETLQIGWHFSEQEQAWKQTITQST